jgi:hypothetical protein
MATTTSTAKPTANNKSAKSNTLAQQYLDSLVKMLDEDFRDVRDISANTRYFVLGLWDYESSLKADNIGPDVVYRDGVTRPGFSATFMKYYNSVSVGVNIVKKFGLNAAINMGISRAHGLGQVMGAYHIRGMDSIIIDPKNSEKMRIVTKYGLEYTPNASTTILHDIYQTSFGGFTGAQRAMAASLCILREKIKNKKNLNGAIAAYLGTGKDVVTGITTSKYLEKVTALADQYSKGTRDVSPSQNGGTQVATSSDITIDSCS